MVSIKKHMGMRIAAVVLACMVALAAWLAFQPAGTASADDASSTEAASSDTVRVYRLYNKWSNEHFYTADQAEYNDLIGRGWNDEQVGWVAPAKGDAVYRLYNQWSGDHHFTTDKTEYNKCVKQGWTGENVAFYSGGDYAVYRLFNPYEKQFFHHYTMDKSEYEKCQKSGWKDEGVGWKAVALGGQLKTSDLGPNDTVYTQTQTSKCYHRINTCNSLNRWNIVWDSTKAEAEAGGLTPCKNCFPLG